MDSQVALLSVDHGRYFEANKLGGVIWRLLEEPHSVSDIVNYLISGYRVEREQCMTDVVRFLNALTAAGLAVQGPLLPHIVTPDQGQPDLLPSTARQ